MEDLFVFGMCSKDPESEVPKVKYQSAKEKIAKRLKGV